MNVSSTTTNLGGTRRYTGTQKWILRMCVLLLVDALSPYSHTCAYSVAVGLYHRNRGYWLHTIRAASVSVTYIRPDLNRKWLGS